MKKVLGLSVAAIGMWASAASAAQAQTTGYFGVNAARQEAEALGFSADADAYGVDGAVTFPAGGSLAFLLDGSYIDSDDADGSLSGTAHLINRNDSHAFGGFVGLSDSDDDTVYAIGGEYARFFANSTFVASAGYGSLDDSDVDLFGLNGEFRIFGSDNLRFDINGGWNRAEVSGFDADVFSGGVGVEYRFANSPISLAGAYTHVELDDLDADSDTFAVALRFDFGNESLKGRDRTGNTFGAFGGLAGALGVF